MTTLANSNAGGLTRPQTTGRTILQGEDESDTLIPRIHIYQGLPAERDQYGDHKPGAFINTVSFEEVSAVNFVPIFGWKEWIKFGEQRGTGIEYRTRSKAEVPAEDLEFDRVNGKGPKCTTFINFCVLFEGTSEPLVLSFKSTSIAAGKTLNTLEKMRGAKGPGLYAMELIKRQNSKGSWLSPRIRPLGDPKPEDKAMAEGYAQSFSPDSVKTNLDESGSAAGEEDASGFDPNAA